MAKQRYTTYSNDLKNCNIKQEVSKHSIQLRKHADVLKCCGANSSNHLSISLEFEDISYVIEMENSKRILKAAKKLKISNPDIQRILDIFDKKNIPIYDDFRYECSLEKAILKLESKLKKSKLIPSNHDILNNPSFKKFLLKDSQCKSILESIDKHALELHDPSSNAPELKHDPSSDASDLMGELSSGD